MPNDILIKKKIKPFINKIFVTSDKSLSIRCVLLASIAIGTSKIENLLESEDVLNTLRAVKKLGIKYKKKKKNYIIYGSGLNGLATNSSLVLDAGNSGTLARLILGLLAKTKSRIKIIGDKSLSKRDFSRVVNPLKNFGINIKSNNGFLPVKTYGGEFLRPIYYEENIGSAQCKSAILLAALNTAGITKIKAKKSRNHTELLMKSIKIPIKVKSTKKFDLIELRGLNEFEGFDYKVPGDISSSAFFIVLTLLANDSRITIKDININKSRTGIVKILNMMNAKISYLNKKIYKGEQVADIFVKSNSKLKSINCPESLNSSAIDEFLVIFLVASKAKGISQFRNLGELNKKESPRLEIAIKLLRMIGIKVERKNNNLKIHGKPDLNLKGKFVVKDYFKDHRVFMMCCIAALVFGGEWKIYDKKSINTSFPNFIKILRKLGAKIT
tara:strand:- start:203 stop:1528 length:1326 start_codon:yes stop_codon:yes gene_type:complete